MPLPVLTIADLALFAQKPEQEFNVFTAEALRQAAFFISLRTKIKTMPADPELAELIRMAILDVAYRLYLDRQYAIVRAKPFQSETIGSYSYSKSATAQSALTGRRTGIMWLDLLLDYLSGLRGTGLVDSDAVTVFEHDGMAVDASGRRYVYSIAPLSLGAYNDVVQSEAASIMAVQSGGPIVTQPSVTGQAALWAAQQATHRRESVPSDTDRTEPGSGLFY